MISRLARSEDYKGHREIIGVWPAVREKIPDAELTIVGDGDLRPDLEKLVAEKRVGNCVHFVGQVSEEEKEKVLQQGSCFLMPSRGEGFGLVYLEAMRLGKPCLVSNADAGREVVNPPEAGLSADPKDPASLANAICELLRPTNHDEARANAVRRRYEMNFTAELFQRRLSHALFSDLA
jgi:phosphatidylinositol alpha-1,6-mannosyltransferase